MGECFEIQDLNIYRDEHEFTRALREGIDRNIKLGTGNISLSHIYRNIMKASSNIHKTSDFLDNASSCLLYKSDLYNMNILLLGEFHTVDTKFEKRHINSVDIKEFIETQISTATDYVDLFIEFSYQYRNISEKKFIKRRQKWPVNNMIDSALYYFKSTGNFKKQYPYVRMHLVDIRQTHDELVFKVINQTSLQKYKANKDIIIQVLDILESKESRLEYFSDLAVKYKIMKQINNIDDKSLSKKLYDYFLTCISDDYFASDYPFIKSDILKRYNPKKDDYGGFIGFSHRLLQYCTVLMDVYTVARLFRTYSVKNPNIYSGRSRNSIIYTGSAHTRNYIKIFEYLGVFEKKYENGKEKILNTQNDEYVTRLDISKLEQPVFLDKTRIIEF